MRNPHSVIPVEAGHLFETIGRTPLIRLEHVTQGSKLELLGKLEYFSPSGSLKDRIYWRMFTEAEARGELRPGMTVVECSTGNAGMASAINVTLPDGSARQVSPGTTPLEIAGEIGPRLARAAVVARLDGNLVDLIEIVDHVG